MFGSKPNPATATPAQLQGYALHKQRMAERSRKQSRDSREISGDMPPCVNPRRKAQALKNLRIFCRKYFPDVFYLPFSSDHLKVLKKMEDAVTGGGQFSLAMPRGSGKTAICVAAAIWSILQGRHEFVLLIGSTKRAATDLLESVKTQFETNELLYEDFREVCYPIRALEGVAQRRLLWKGELIRQNATKERLILPNLPPNPAASACLSVAGLTGRIRGLKLTRPDGREVRPSLAIIDDPQTHKSAKSPKQCEDRERIINGDVLGLSGPDKKISAIMPCTVIFRDDMADRLLDREKNPQWRGERTKLIYEWPKGETAQRHWEEYAAIYRQCLANSLPTTKATTYYRKNRRAMETGAVVAWPERRYDGALSALQHAFNLRITVGHEAFESEYQNSPPRQIEDDEQRLDKDKIAARFNNLERGVVPTTAAHLTCFIDVQAKVLPYMVVAWAPNFTGYIIDYGSHPDQGRMYWTKRDAERIYSSALPGAGFEAQLYEALQTLTEKLLSKEWPREGRGSTATIDRCLIDSGWGESTDTVFEFARRSRFRSLIYPSKGKGVRATQTPFMDYKPADGVISRNNWRTSPDTQRRAIRSVLFETNAWKTFCEKRLMTPVGGPGALTVFGDGQHLHRMLADHLTSERPIVNVARGRTVAEWQEPEPGRDNDWWDCLVGCAVGASIQGADVMVAGPPLKPPPAGPKTRTNFRPPPGHSSFFITNR